jgi:thiamine biosynthesis lipoprotein
MSTYIPDSELSRLNKARAGNVFRLSDETNTVLLEALRLHELSRGKLDITVGPVVNMWGFGPQARPEVIPSEQALLDVRNKVGVDKFVLKDKQVTKLVDDLYIDLSTIAKGYAVDMIAELISENYGIDNYLVEIGGEMRVAGSKPQGENWHVAVVKPINGPNAIQRIIYVGDNAVASSGDYRNYFEQDGVRYSHLIDPTTAYPIQHKLVSVTVVADKAITADGLATALIVMGTEDGRELAEQEGIAALFITKEGDEFVEYASTEYIKQVVTIN